VDRWEKGLPAEQIGGKGPWVITSDALREWARGWCVVGVGESEKSHNFKIFT
jgi:hypothetical protein